MFEWIATLLGLRPKTTGVTAAMEGRLVGKLESLLASTANAIVGVQSDGSIAIVNPQTENLFGYLRDEVLGKSVEFLLPEIFQPGILGRRTLFLLDPQTRRMGEGLELHGRRKDGSEFPADVGVSQFKHEELVAVFFIRDMTDILQAEQALLESREEFREIVESAPDAMVIADSEGCIQLVNAETEKLFGYTREELLGQAVEMLVPEDVRSTHRKHLAGYLAEPRVRAAGQGLEPHGQRKDGSVFPVEIRLSPLHTKEGILVSSVIRDVTERKRAERERERLLHRTNKRVKELRCMYGVAESIRKRETLEQVCEDVVALIPPGWHYPEITRGRIRFDDQEFVSQPFEETEWRQSADIVIGGKPRGTVEVFYLEECPELDEGPFLKEEHDLVDGIARTLSEAMEHEKVRKERERLMSAIEHGADIVVVTDPEGTIQYVNPAFEKITGYTRKEAIGQNPRILKSGEQDDAFYKELWDTLTRGETWSGQLVNKRKDGTLFTEEATISPVCDSAGKIINYIGVKRDVTEQRILEEQLIQAQRMETVGRLAGGVAHDFNNMLSVILGSAELVMTRDDLDDSMLRRLQLIKEAAERSAEITSQLLAFSRKQVIEPRVVKLNPLIEDMGEMLGRLLGEDIDILSVPEKEIWNTKADPGQIHQIVANLCINARDAMPKGGKLTIETANVTIDEAYCRGHAGFVPGRFVMLAVSDNGIGMDRETLSHIFEPFFTTKDEGRGTGLGLATVHGIVKQHNGFINVYSELGQGTTFKLYFPQSVEEAEEAEKAVETPKPIEAVWILLVEDEEMVRNLAEMMLEEMGHRVLVAGTPKEALALCEEGGMDIDLLLSDVVMPQMSGKELKELIEALRPGIKTLFMSGYTTNIIARHGVLEKGTHFIQKPFSMNELARKVREAVEQ